MSSSNTYDSHLTSVIRRSNHCLSLRINKPANFQYKAGQYTYVSFKSSLGTKRKHLTISSSPTEPFLEVTKRLTMSDFSKGLFEQKKGDWVRLEGPYGDFVANPDYQKIAMICGGIGITPLRSIVKFFADMEYGNDIVLIYSSKTKDDFVFKQELDALMKKEGLCFKVFYSITQPDDGWMEHVGRIDEIMIKGLVPDFLSRVFYTSGPPAMVDAVLNLLKSLYINGKNIITEYFPGYSSHHEINTIIT